MAIGPRGDAGLASPGFGLSARSVIVARSTPMSGGAIAGAVVGSVVGALFILLCAYPFLARARRRARGEEPPFDPEAEIAAAQAEAAAAAAAGGSVQTTTSTSGRKESARRLSVDHFAPDGTAQASPRDGRQTTKELEMSSGYSNANDAATAAVTASPVALSQSFFAAPGQPFAPQDGSPAPQASPFTGPPRMQTFQTADTMDTSATAGRPAQPSRRSTRSSVSSAFKSVTNAFRRTSTRSIPSQGLASAMQAMQPTQNDNGQIMDPTISPPPTFSPIDNMPISSGEAASYYSGAITPPTSAYSPIPTQLPYPAFTSPLPMPYQMGQAMANQSPMQQQQASQLQPGFVPMPYSQPMSPTSDGMSPRIKEEVLSEDEDLSAIPDAPQPKKMAKRMTFPKQQGPKIPLSPSQAGPGTVNPMDIMGPTNASERSWMVQSELVKIENSPPPQSPPPALQVSTPETQPQLHDAQDQQSQAYPANAATISEVNGVGSPESMAGDFEGDTSMYDDYVILDTPVDAEPIQQQLPQAELQQEPEVLYRPQQLFTHQQPQELLPQTPAQTQEQQHQHQHQLLQHEQDQFQPQNHQFQQFEQPQQYQQYQQYEPQQTYPHTPTYIKSEHEPLPPQIMTPGVDISDYSTPQQASHSSGMSVQGTPDTRLTPPGSNYTPTPSPISNPPLTPGNLSGTDAPAQDVSPKPFACEQCHRSFNQVHKLNHHRRYHQRPHQCTDCDMSFGTKTHLDRHVNDKHKKTRQYHCIVEGCQFSRTGDRAFPRKDNWRRHMINKHNLTPDQEPIEVNMEQPLEQPMDQPMNQPMNQPMMSQPMGQLFMNQPFMNQPMNQAMNQPMNQPFMNQHMMGP